MLLFKMCSDAAGALLSVPIACRKNIVNTYNTTAKNLGSFAEIVKDVALLSVLTLVFFQQELDFNSCHGIQLFFYFL